MPAAQLCLAQVLPRQQLSAVLLPSPPSSFAGLAAAAVVAAVAALVALAIAALRRCALMGSGFIPTPSRRPLAVGPSFIGRSGIDDASNECKCVRDVRVSCVVLRHGRRVGAAVLSVGSRGMPIHSYMPYHMVSRGPAALL